jgi:hypothetical protein
MRWVVAVAFFACGSSAGTPGDGGIDSSASLDGASDGGAAGCKRGVATNTAPSSAFASTSSVPGIAWWYDWSLQGTGGEGEFVPMVWGSATLSDPIPTSAKFLLGFNEPNFIGQSNLTPTQAAADWPMVQAHAQAAGIPIVSPAVNFCGSSMNASQCSDPQVTDPYTYLKDFFQACAGCEVDAIAVHWYNCDLPSLKAYIEGNGSLEGFVQFGKPIWLTEFSCDGSHSVADQKAYMQAAVPYLEASPYVARYAWFSAMPIPNAMLANSDGSLTELGQTYVSLAKSCP